jgi:hypothetical protein
MLIDARHGNMAALGVVSARVATSHRMFVVKVVVCVDSTFELKCGTFFVTWRRSLHMGMRVAFIRFRVRLWHPVFKYSLQEGI